MKYMLCQIPKRLFGHNNLTTSNMNFNIIAFLKQQALLDFACYSVSKRKNCIEIDIMFLESNNDS